MENNNSLTVTSGTYTANSGYLSSTCCPCSTPDEFEAYAWESLVKATLRVLESGRPSQEAVHKADYLLSKLLDTAIEATQKGKACKS